MPDETAPVEAMTPAPDAPAEPNTEDQRRRERQRLFARCERFLGGHTPRTPAQVLAEIAVEAGDDEADTYGQGDLIDRFEREIADLLGKEAAVFLPSGTMAQQIALRIWSERKHSATFVCHPTCHLESHEEKGYQRLHGLHARLAGNPNLPLTLDDLRGVAEPLCALLIELPQREIGGTLPSWDELTAQVEWARSRGAAAHMDGARLWEAAPYYERSYAEIAALFDTVYVSFYKGIGAIAGAALAGPADVIAEARVWQVRHGGRLIHLYPYVLAARAGLRRELERFPGYHQRALRVAAALSAVPGVLLKPNPPQAHMMHVYLRGDRDTLLAASEDLARTERVCLFRNLFPSELPDYSKFELSIYDAAAALSDEEITGYFRRVVERG
jgi:threonine aldolase